MNSQYITKHIAQNKPDQVFSKGLAALFIGVYCHFQQLYRDYQTFLINSTYNFDFEVSCP